LPPRLPPITPAKRFLTGVICSSASTNATTKSSMKSRIGVLIGVC